jgi:hypothetical protein
MLNVETELFIAPAPAPPLLNLPAPQATTPTSRRYIKASSPSSHKMTTQGSISQNPAPHQPMRTGRRNAGSGSASRRASQSERERDPSEREGGLSMMLKSPSRAAANAAAALGLSFGFGSDNDNDEKDRNFGRRQRSTTSDYSRGVHRSSEHRHESTGVNDDADGMDNNNNSYDEELRPGAIMAKRIREMMNLFDVDNDGVISYDEFLWAMTGAGKLYGTDLPENFINKKRRLPNNPSYSSKNKGGLFMNRGTFSRNSPRSNKSTSSSGKAGALENSIKPAGKAFQSEVIVSYVTTNKSEIQSAKCEIPTIDEIKEGNDSSEVIVRNFNLNPVQSEQVVELSVKHQSPAHSIHASTAVENNSNIAVKSEEINHPLDGESIATLPVYRRSSLEACDIGNRSMRNFLALEPVHDEDVLKMEKTDIENPAVKSGTIEKVNSGLLSSLSGILGIGSSSSGKGSGTSHSILSLRKTSSKLNAIVPYARTVSSSSNTVKLSRNTNTTDHHIQDEISPKHDTSIAIADTVTVQDDPTDMSVLSKHPSWHGALPAITSRPDSENNSGMIKLSQHPTSNQSDKARKSSIMTTTTTLDELLAMTTSVEIPSAPSNKFESVEASELLRKKSSKSSKKVETDGPLAMIPPRKYSQVKYRRKCTMLFILVSGALILCSIVDDDPLHLRLSSPQVFQPPKDGNISTSHRTSSQSPSPIPHPQFTSPFSQAAQNVLKS